jgi:pimeloyl-ACP methyl ester carboxylesterase
MAYSRLRNMKSQGFAPSLVMDALKPMPRRANGSVGMLVTLMPNSCLRVRVMCLLTVLSAGGCTTFATVSQSASPSHRVDEAGFVSIGGIDQWISMRGADSGDPLILVVHGGPGEAQWPAASKYESWQQDFVVVQWDQRGTGRTFGRSGIQTPDVNLYRITRDGIEVVEHLCRILGKKKVIVLGHSWGSIVAIHMVQLRPDLFAAYVGTGQVASWKAAVQLQFDLLLQRARRDNDKDLARELEAIGLPDPSNATQYFHFTRGLSAAMPASDQEWLKNLRASTPTSLGVDPKDFRDLLEGMTFSARRVLPDQMSTDLPSTATNIRTAFFVIQGRDDITTPTAAAVAYFNSVRAPTKELILIDGAGHFAFMTHPREFLAILTDKVRPVAVSGGG